jgi:hypothetical protein
MADKMTDDELTAVLASGSDSRCTSMIERTAGQTSGESTD